MKDLAAVVMVLFVVLVTAVVVKVVVYDPLTHTFAEVSKALAVVPEAR